MSRADAMYTALGMPIKKPLEGLSGALISMATVGSSGSRCVGVPRSLSPPASEPRECQQGATEKTPQSLGARSRVSAGVPLLPRHQFCCCRGPPQPQALHTLWSFLGRAGPCLCARTFVLGQSPITASSRTLRLPRLRGSCGRMSGPSGAHCTPKSAANTCVWTGDFSPLTPHSQTLAWWRPGTLCLCFGDPSSSRSRSRLGNTSISSRLKVGFRSCATWSPKGDRPQQQPQSPLPVEESRRSLSLLWAPIRRCVGTNLRQPGLRSLQKMALSGWRKALPKLPPVTPARLLSAHAEIELRQLSESFATDSRKSLPQCSPLASSSPTRPPACAATVKANP